MTSGRFQRPTAPADPTRPVECWVVTLTWVEDEHGRPITCARTSYLATEAEATARFCELDRLIRFEAWRPNLRARDVQVDLPYRQPGRRTA